MFRVIIKTEPLRQAYPGKTLVGAIEQALIDAAAKVKAHGEDQDLVDAPVQSSGPWVDGVPSAIMGYQDGDVVEGHEEAHARGVMDERARLAGVFSAIREEELKGERACRVPGSIDPVQEKIHRHRVEWCGDMINKIYNGCV